MKRPRRSSAESEAQAPTPKQKGRGGWSREPVNTWDPLAKVFAAVLVLAAVGLGVLAWLASRT